MTTPTKPKRRAITKLSDLKLSEISLCGVPASTGADVHLFKGSILRGPAFNRGMEFLSDDENGQELFEKAISSAEQAMQDALNDGAVMKDGLENDLAQAVFALAAAFDGVASGEPGEQANVTKSAADFSDWLVSNLFEKSKDHPVMANLKKTKADPAGTGKIVHAEHIDPAMDAGKMKGDGSMVPGEVGKSVVLEEGDMVIKSGELDSILKAHTAPLEAKIAKMQEDADDKERETLAKSLCHGVAHAKPDEVASILKALSGNKTAYDAYVATFDAQRAASANITKSHGADGSFNTPVSAGSFEQKVEAEISKAATNGQTISKADAMLAVCQADPAAYRAYRTQQARLNGNGDDE